MLGRDSAYTGLHRGPLILPVKGGGRTSPLPLTPLKQKEKMYDHDDFKYFEKSVTRTPTELE